MNDFLGQRVHSENQASVNEDYAKRQIACTSFGAEKPRTPFKHSVNIDQLDKGFTVTGASSNGHEYRSSKVACTSLSEAIRCTSIYLEYGTFTMPDETSDEAE